MVATLTDSAKKEICAVKFKKVNSIKAELATILRFAGGIQLTLNRVVIEAELDSKELATLVSKNIFDLFGYGTETIVLGAAGVRKKPRYLLRVVKDGAVLARQIGLVDLRGRPIRGLPIMIINGSLEEAEATWRGAFLSRGSLTEPGRSAAMEITCPGPEAALALVGVARRLGVVAKSKEVRGNDKVVVKDGDAISKLLGIMGANSTKKLWDEQRKKREFRGNANRLANFDDANLRRSARAAVAAAARAQKAFEILGPDLPDHLALAGKLRIKHKQASLEELGQLATPPMTKDAIAGRIRRLLSMADKKAQVLGIPNTESVITSDLFDEL